MNQLLVNQSKFTFSSATSTIEKSISNENENKNEDRTKTIRKIANKAYFKYKDFDEDQSFHDILNKTIIKKINTGLYFQNRHNVYQDIEKKINDNTEADKRRLNSLNNNNGSGKTFLLEMLPLIQKADNEKSKKIFFSNRVDFISSVPSKSLITAILDAINLSFELNAKKILPNPNSYIVEIGYILKNLSDYISTEKSEKEKIEAWEELMENYIFSEQKKYRKNYRSRNFDTFCFLFDEIGNLEDCNKAINSKYDIFDESSKNRIRKIEELRALLNENLLVHRNLDVVLAGKNGIAPFMGSSTESVQEINQFNLPPLNKEYLPSIMKFELYKENSKFKDLLKQEFTGNNRNDENLEKFIYALLNKLFIYTGGHPRILCYSLKRLFNIKSIKDMLFEEQLSDPSFKNHKDVLDKLTKSQSSLNDLLSNQKDTQYSEFLDFLLESLMKKIKPENFNRTLLSRFNDDLLYILFCQEIDIFHKLKDDYKIIAYFYLMLDRMEIKFNVNEMNTILNKFIKKKTDKVNNSKKYIEVDSEQFMNALGLPFKAEDGNIIAYFPKYVSDSLEEMLTQETYSDEFIENVLYFKYKYDSKKYFEIASIYSYAKSLSNEKKSNRLFKYMPYGIEGKSNRDSYIGEIFNQLSAIPTNTKGLIDSIPEKHLVLFKLSNNFAFDGIVLTVENEILTLSFIQAKSTQDQKQKSIIASGIYENIKEVIRQFNAELESRKQLQFLEKYYDAHNVKIRFVVTSPNMAEDIVKLIAKKFTNAADKREVVAFNYSIGLNRHSLVGLGIMNEICEKMIDK